MCLWLVRTELDVDVDMDMDVDVDVDVTLLHVAYSHYVGDP